MLNTGNTTEVLPIIKQESTVLLYLRLTNRRLRAMREARFDIPGFAEDVPIGIPDVEEDIRTYELLVPTGEGVLAGALPAPGSLSERTGAAIPLVWVQVETLNSPVPPVSHPRG